MTARIRPANCWSSYGLDGSEDPAHLSGGEARRAARACWRPIRTSAAQPTNHLDLTTIEWLERTLESRRSALVMISHDRRFLSNLSRSTVWLDRGETRRVERGFADFEDWRDEVLAEEERTSTSSTARSSPRSTGCATAYPDGASAT